jgi:hypothetical protein
MFKVPTDAIKGDGSWQSLAAVASTRRISVLTSSPVSAQFATAQEVLVIDPAPEAAR